MKLPAPTNKLLSAAVACMLAIGAQAGTFTDNFNSSRDYKSQGVAGTPWSGITAGTVTPGNIVGWDANVTSNNTLTIINQGGEWADGGDGPFLWTTVKGSGDFTNTVHVSYLAQTNYNFAGLMLRDPNSPSNWLYFSVFAEFNLELDWRDTTNGVSAEGVSSGINFVETNSVTWRSWLQVTRVAGVISTFASTDGISWEAVYQSPRTDFTNDLQVGVFDSTFSPNVCSAQFQNFSIVGPGVSATPLPAAATGLSVTPGTGFLNVAWTAGAGSAGSVVVVRRANPITRQPLDGATYSGSATFGSGTDLGESNYVAYVGVGTSVTLTNLTPTIPYTVAVYSYTGSGASTLYGITNAPAATAAPFGTPTGIAVTLTGTNAVAVDDTMQAAVTLFFAGGGQIDVTAGATYTSSNTNVATISSSGLAAGLSVGVTTITANYSTFSATTNLTVVKPPTTDDFTTPKDYLTEGIAGSPWHGLLLGTNDIPFGGFTGGLGKTLIANAGITKSGRLTVQSTDTGFDAPENDGFLLYRVIDGDFSISVQVTSFTNLPYHMPGLLVRAPFELSFAENSLALVGFNEFGIGNFVRNITSGTKNEVAQQSGAAKPFIKIERQTNTFNFYQKAHALDPWTLIWTQDRADLAGIPLQVGIVDQIFTANVGTAEFDNLVITASPINSPSAPSGPSNLALSSAQIGKVSATWTPGAGSAGSIVVAHVNAPVTRQAVDGNDFSATANADLGLGFDLGGSNVVVYAGPGNSVVASNLPPTYTSFAVYSFATVSGTNYYNHLAAATNSVLVLGLPTISQQPPAALTRYQGRSVSISAGASPGNYRWQLNGTNVVNGGRIAGASATTLSISNLVSADAGNYTFINTNTAGSITSSPTVLTVLVPTNSSELSVLANGPTAFWRLNESSGVTASDYVGGYDGTHGPADVLGVDGPRPVDGFAFFETTNLAAQFAGNASSSAVTFPALTVGPETVGALTITAWIKPAVLPTDRAGVVSFSAPAETGLRLYGSPNGLSILWNNTVSHSGILPPAGQWSFVAMVINTNGGSLYLATNGGWQVFNDSTPRTPVALTGVNYIGSDRAIAGRYFEGVIDEVSVFKSALSPATITNLFNGVAAPPAVTLSFQKTINGLQLSWPQGILLEAPVLTGPWTTNPAASPLQLTNPAGNKFFRVRVQ